MSTDDPVPLEADSLSALKSSFVFARRARPPPVELEDQSERTPVGRVPKKLARRESRGGLRNIFGRSKSDINLLSSPPITTEELPPSQLRQEASIADHEEEHLPEPEPYIPPSSPPDRRPGLRMTMRPRSAKSKPAPKAGNKPVPKANPPRRTSATWDPPPLFQAYPQAIKHAQLSSSSMSADAIIRISNHRRRGSLREDIAQSELPSAAGEGQPAATKKMEKAKSKHRRQLSGSLAKAQWAEKIYVLVTSGYLLQYAGSGSFDRLPEKMMQLGKDSVAFASDVIPGKHWVLQISQAMATDGTPSPDARSLLSRLSFRNADYRRTATSFLLVLPSAEELESWITAVRREIEALGGKKCVTETGKPKVEADVMRLKSQPSKRFLIQRDPDRFSNAPSSRNPSPNPLQMRPFDHDQVEHVVPLADGDYMSPPSLKRISLATSLGSSSSHPLDSVRDASFRLSYMSSGQRTLVTSQASTPTCSPTRETFGTLEDRRPSDAGEGLRSRVNVTVISERRRTMQAMQALQSPPNEYRAPSKTSPVRPHSTYGGSGPSMVAPSPSTPNFSIPHAVSKRYTLAKMSESGTQAKTPTTTEPMSKVSRRSPPGPLKGPPLSPVRDQPSPVRSPSAYALTGPRPSTGSLTLHDGSDATPEISHAATEPSYSPPPSIGGMPGSPDTSTQSASSVASLPQLPPMILAEPEPGHWAALLPALAVTEQTPTSTRLPALSEAVTENRTSYLAPSDDPRPPSKLSKPWRPTSMQVLPRSPPISYTKGVQSNGNAKGSSVYSSKHVVRSSVLLPAFQSESVRSSPAPRTSMPSTRGLDERKNLMNRRSMPQLVAGPPPAPPPSCALPPIPPGGVRVPMMKESRNSVRV